jgi:chemotaxis protein methyltransferase CheR
VQLPPDSLRAIAELARRRSGIVITDEQAYLLESRLTPVVATFGFGSLGEMAAAIARHPAEALAEAVVEALTTPETSFFRDGYPFDLLRRVMLPDLLQRRTGNRQLRIWSAAAATGQEAYSIGFCLEELGPAVEGWRLEVVGTDLAAGTIARACQGRYSHFEVQRGLPIQLLVRHFERAGQDWRVRPGLRARIRFERHNLLDDAAWLGRFDIVFLRNVLIYFDPPTRRRVLERIAAVLAEDGYLVLGGTETARGLTEHLAADELQPALVRRVRPTLRRGAA